MSFGFGFGFTKITAAIRAAFSPSSLFAANEPGVWYDPSDFSTLFQDAAGTTPVTAVEQPVGLMLDKSKGLVLGPELVTNGDFSDGATGWTVIKGVVNFTGGVATFVPGTDTAMRQNIAISAGKRYQVYFDLTDPGNFGVRVIFSGTATFTVQDFVGSGAKSALLPNDAANVRIEFDNLSNNFSGTIDNISIRELPGNHAYQTTATSRPVLSARVNQYLATETLATQNVTTLAAQYRLSFEGTGTITISGTATGVYLAGSHLITCTAGTLTSTVSGSVTKADLRVANNGVNLPPYQRVNTATDYDTVGFPHYLRFDGVDDWLVTNTITPGTDKAQVFAGVRKLSDGIAASVVELSASVASNTGSFGLFAPANAAPDLQFISHGTLITRATAVTGVAAPITGVLTGHSSISDDSTVLRINGTQAAQSTSDQGAGNYGNYPLYIGRRGGTTLPFNGHLYSLIVRFGPNLPAATIVKAEKYVNTKTRAY